MKKVFDLAKEITNDEYHNNKDFVSSSDVKDILNNIHNYHHMLTTGERKNSGAMEMGTLCHQVVLNSVRDFDLKIFEKAGKRSGYEDALLNKKGSEIVVTKDQVETCEKMKTAFEQYKDLVEIRDSSRKELSFFIDDLRLKCRSDLLYLKENTIHIFDYKTTSDISNKAIHWNLQGDYGIQAAFYVNFFEKLLKDEKLDIKFSFIFQHKTAPYSVKMINLSKDFIKDKMFKVQEGFMLLEALKKYGIEFFKKKDHYEFEYVGEYF